MQTLPSIDCCTACKLCFQNYAKCSGRSRRSEFWYFFLMLFLFNIAYQIIYRTIYYNSYYYYDSYDNREYNIGLLEFVVIVYALLAILFFIPYVSVTVRRLHDTGRSGLYIFVSFIPFAGPFILLYFCCLDSEERPNEYGPSPKFIVPLNQPINPAPISPYPQQNYDQVPVSPYPQAPMVQPYPQPNPMPPQPYMAPPQGPYPGQGNPYP